MQKLRQPKASNPQGLRPPDAVKPTDEPFSPPLDPDSSAASLSDFASAISPAEFQAALLGWFDRHGRKDLPWQTQPTPYRVWVSEIMLQQTQVATVIPYYQRFMERFPGLRDLAEAPLEEVLRHWAGLGYYARARNLHRAAQVLHLHHAGNFPEDPSQLCALPGIGRSTAGAILSMGMGIRAPILDGNVKRVLSRVAAVEGWPGEAQTARKLWKISEDFTPNIRVGEYTQAIMDLGATLCTPRRPACTRCPLRTDCRAYRLNATETLPVPRPKRRKPVRRCFMLALKNDEGAFCLQKRPPAGIWGGLWSFPDFEPEAELIAWCRSKGIDASTLERLPERRHTFTHFHLDYVPVVGQTSMPLRIEEDVLRWRRAGEEDALPAPVRRLMTELVDVAQGPSGD
jgi:A/G-specific adenine glycosylase